MDTGGSDSKESASNSGDVGSIPGSGEFLKERLQKGTANQSSILAWRIPGTEEPGRQQSMGSQKSQTGLSG